MPSQEVKWYESICKVKVWIKNGEESPSRGRKPPFFQIENLTFIKAVFNHIFLFQYSTYNFILKNIENNRLAFLKNGRPCFSSTSTFWTQINYLTTNPSCHVFLREILVWFINWTKRLLQERLGEVTGQETQQLGNEGQKTGQTEPLQSGQWSSTSALLQNNNI